jgi:hypothetical protein
MIKKTIIVLVASVAAFSSALAQDSSGKFNLGVKAGTLGGGIEADLKILDSLHLRGGVNYLKYSFESIISNVDYDMEPEYKNGSPLLDWYPFSGAFRLSGGVFLNNNEIGITGTPRKDLYTIPDEYSFATPYIDSIRVHGTAEFNTFSPYIGVGWNSNVEKMKGWGVSFELGVLFQGSPEISSLYATADGPLNDYANHPEVLKVLENEKQAIEDDLEEFQYYPVASFMVHYTF